VFFIEFIHLSSIILILYNKSVCKDKINFLTFANAFTMEKEEISDAKIAGSIL
jgi:hypothetical protein